MRAVLVTIIILINNICFGQYGVSLGKDGIVYQGENFRQNGWVSPIDIPLDSYMNLYSNNGVRFSIKLVLGDDPFDRALMRCEKLDPITNQVERDYGGRVIYHYRVIFLLENNNIGKDVEFINTTSSSVELENIGMPTVFSACRNNTGTILRAFTGNIVLGSQSSIEICDSHDGEWFFDKPKLTEWFLSNYVLRSSSTSNPINVNQPKVSCDVIPVTPHYSLNEEEESDKPQDSPQTVDSDPQRPKPQFPLDINTNHPDFWNGKVDEKKEQAKEDLNNDFWSSSNEKEKTEKKTASNITNKKTEVDPRKSPEKTIKKKTTSSLIGTWVLMETECYSDNGEPLYFIFEEDGTGETSSTNCRKICYNGTVAKFNFTYSESNIQFEYDHRNSATCELSSDYPWIINISNYALSGDNLSFSGLKFERQ